jgi:ribosomal protein S18 acetylase RimI-like enzyme
MIHSFKFIVAAEQDAAVVETISKQTFFDTFHEQNTVEDMQLFLDEYFNLKTIKDEIANKANTLLLLYIEDRPVGYVKLTESNEVFEKMRSLEIARLYVAKDEIGKGIGAALMKRSIDIAKERNKEVIWLGVWEHNARAINFYCKWGFEKFGEHLFMLGNDKQNDWLMKKII